MRGLAFLLALAPLFPPLAGLALFFVPWVRRLPLWGQALLALYGASLLLPALFAPRARALLYGLLGAYLLRGLALLFAVFLIRLWWAQVLGGLYLVYLMVQVEEVAEGLRSEEHTSELQSH